MNFFTFSHDSTDLGIYKFIATDLDDRHFLLMPHNDLDKKRRE